MNTPFIEIQLFGKEVVPELARLQPTCTFYISSWRYMLGESPAYLSHADATIFVDAITIFTFLIFYFLISVILKPNYKPSPINYIYKPTKLPRIQYLGQQTPFPSFWMLVLHTDAMVTVPRKLGCAFLDSLNVWACNHGPSMFLDLHIRAHHAD